MSYVFCFAALECTGTCFSHVQNCEPAIASTVPKRKAWTKKNQTTKATCSHFVMAQSEPACVVSP